MKYLFINSVLGFGSTGKIVSKLCRDITSEGNQCVAAWGRKKINCNDIDDVRIGNKVDQAIHLVKSRIFDSHGFESRRSTQKFIEWIEEYKPDIIWLHNLHGYYLNVDMLFQYIKSRNIKVIWTLHDCWTFTGHCAFFSHPQCDNWRTGCGKCIRKRDYPVCYFQDNSATNFQKKKEAFTGVKDLKIIVPSRWLEGLVKESFLSEYPVEVVYNTINTTLFRPTSSDYRQKYQLEDKIVLLGVANPWSPRKGLADFIMLAGMLDERYRIMLVGLTKKQIKKMPKNVIGIERTNSAEELAKIYTMADLFLNLTYEDNYPTTNLEAQACGTPCITYRTGGSIESVDSSNVVEQGNIEMLIDKIKELC